MRNGAFRQHRPTSGTSNESERGAQCGRRRTRFRAESRVTLGRDGAYLNRFVEEQRLLAAETAGQSDEQTAYVRRMEQVGKRVAELQLALASR